MGSTVLTLRRYISSTVVLTGVVLGGAACDEFNVDSRAPVESRLLSAPTTAVGPVSQQPRLETELAVYAIFDITSSADRFSLEAKAQLAASVAAWPKPGRGGLDVTVAILSSRSWDASQQLLSAHVDGLPPEPVRPTTTNRPQKPDLGECKSAPFGRDKCEATAVATYNTALSVVLEEERQAEAEFQSAVAEYELLVAARRSEAAAIGERILNVDLGKETAGSDVQGALLRAAETLAMSTASSRIALVASDMVPYGKQQPGTLNLSDTNVVVFYFDCPQGTDCTAHRQAQEALLLSAGAKSVAFFDPASSRLIPSILEVTN